MNDLLAVSIMRNLPRGQLPATYENAKLALARCAKMDECKTWADKAKALASYARQANDNRLRQLSERIQARAIRREGELLQEIEAATNRHDVSSGAGGGPSKGRFAAGRSAGLSDRQTKTALRVANIPADLFEKLVESENPPTCPNWRTAVPRPRSSRC